MKDKPEPLLTRIPVTLAICKDCRRHEVQDFGDKIEEHYCANFWGKDDGTATSVMTTIDGRAVEYSSILGIPRNCDFRKAQTVAAKGKRTELPPP